MVRTARLARSLAGLALVLLCAGACSSAKSDDTTSASPTAAAGAVAAPSGAPAITAATTAIDPCKKLTLADVQPFFSATLSAKHDDNLFGSAAGCWYRTPDDHTNLQITAVTGAQAEAFYKGNVDQGGEKDLPLPGVGDKAVRRPGGVAVVALKGDVLCMLYTGNDSRASLKGAEKYVGAAMPDSVAVPLARSLATLCTKLWQ